MPQTASKEEADLGVLDGRKIRDRTRAIVSGGIDRATAEQFNLIGALLHRALDPELDPDLTKEIIISIYDNDIEFKFYRNMGGEFLWRPMRHQLTNDDYFVTQSIVQVRGVFLKLKFAEDLIVAARASIREATSIVKSEREKANRLSSKWSEDNRTAQQVKVRLEPELLAKVERQAVKDGLSRNAWISRALEAALPKP